MRNPLYKTKPSYNHCYFYSVSFVGHDRPIIYSDNEYEYYEIRDRFAEWTDQGKLERYGINKFTKFLVRRIDLMKKTERNSIEAKTHLKSLVKKHGALNDPDRPQEPATLLKFLCEREEELEKETQVMELEMLCDTRPFPANKDEFMMRILERKFNYIYKDLEKQWKSKSKRASKLTTKTEIKDAVT